jgi:uncharacterized coiled-coil protein SlyX
MNFREVFARGRQEALTRHGFDRPARPLEPPRGWPDQEPPAPPDDTAGDLQARINELEAECAKKKQALEELVPFVEQLQARIADLLVKLRDLGADYDQKVQALDELIPYADQLKARNAALQAECTEKKEALDGLVPFVEQLQARIAELEATPPDDAEVFTDVLRLPAISTKSVKVPAVRNLLADRFHPAKHPKAEDDALLALNEATLKINAAYDAIKRRRSSSGG